MTALRSDITLIRGDTENITFSLTSNGEDVSLSDSTVFFTAKPALTDDATDSTAVIAVDVTGSGTIPLSSTDTDVDPGDYYYDIQVKNNLTGAITSIPSRLLTVVADVTRRTA